MSASDSTYGWDDTLDISLHDKLRKDLKASMLNKDIAVKDAIRVIMSEFFRITVPIKLESGKKTTRPKAPDEITNDDIIDVLRGLAKSEKTTLELKKEATSTYLQVLESYLPQLATAEEITAWVKANVNLADFKSPMQAMRPIMKHFGKRADGNMIKEILQKTKV